MGNIIVKVFGSAGSEGIPVPFCNCKSCKEMKPRRRVGYAIETEEATIWLSASPDIREQLLEFGKLPDYLFISHTHMDHFQGLTDLRQALIVGEVAEQLDKKITLLIPQHIYNYLETIKPFANLLRESAEKAFWELVETGTVNLTVLKPKRWYSLTQDLKIRAIDNVHAGLLSTSLFIKYKEKSILYLADAEKLDEDIFAIIDDHYVDLIIAHTPFILKKEVHLGIEDLENIKAKKILLSHFSHKIRMSEEELYKFVRERDKEGKFIVAYDGLVLEI